MSRFVNHHCCLSRAVQMQITQHQYMIHVSLQNQFSFFSSHDCLQSLWKEWFRVESVFETREITVFQSSPLLLPLHDYMCILAWQGPRYWGLAGYNVSHMGASDPGQTILSQNIQTILQSLNKTVNETSKQHCFCAGQKVLCCDYAGVIGTESFIHLAYI